MRLDRSIWLDAHLPPALAPWLVESFDADAISFDRLGYRSSADETVFAAAHDHNAIIMTKDADFPRLVAAKGGPPSIIWLTFGNASMANLKEILATRLGAALAFIKDGEWLVEIARPED